MVYAFVLLKTGAAASPSVLEVLTDLPAVREAHVVAGEYDLIAEVEADEVHEILDLVSDTIQSIEGADETKTYITLD
ncbi:MAG: Lrp/AsnC family transcriptional regulator [Halobacteriales archaeon]